MIATMSKEDVMGVLGQVWGWVYRATGAAALDRWLARRRADEYDDLALAAEQAGVGQESVATLRRLAAHERAR